MSGVLGRVAAKLLAQEEGTIVADVEVAWLERELRHIAEHVAAENNCGVSDAFEWLECQAVVSGSTSGSDAP